MVLQDKLENCSLFRFLRKAKQHCWDRCFSTFSQGLYGCGELLMPLFSPLFFSLLVSESVHQVWNRNLWSPETSSLVVQDLQWTERGKIQLWRDGAQQHVPTWLKPVLSVCVLFPVLGHLEGSLGWSLGALAGGQAGSVNTHNGDNFGLWGGGGEKTTRAPPACMPLWNFCSYGHKETVTFCCCALSLLALWQINLGNTGSLIQLERSRV